MISEGKVAKGYGKPYISIDANSEEITGAKAKGMVIGFPPDTALVLRAMVYGLLIIWERGGTFSPRITRRARRAVRPGTRSGLRAGV